MRCTAIVVAGGSGRRFGGPKQFAILNGEVVAARSVSVCRSVADEVILVVPAGLAADPHGADRVVVGGETRSASVRAGLALVDESVDAVLIHDAARPLATERLFFSVLAELADPSVDGAIAALGVTDTIKEVSETDGRRHVVATLDRSRLVAVQTPQVFRTSILRQAHESEPEATDDAALVEAVGGMVIAVPGEVENLKLTSPRDLDEAERLIERV